jgi:hypothetical protein
MGQNILIYSYDSFVTNDHIFVHGRMSLFSMNQHLRILQINGVDRKMVFVYLHFLKTQLSFINGLLDLLIENIAIINSMRISIMPHIVSSPFQFI